jgi:integrase/recombinase XerD
MKNNTIIKQKVVINRNNLKAINRYKEYLASLRRTDGTQKNVEYVLNRLARFLGSTKFEDANEKQMQNYFNTIKSFSTFNIYGAIIIRFLAWNSGLEERAKTPNMKWFKYISDKRMRKEADPRRNEKYLITPQEYQQILDASRDKYGFYEALWEVFYLSGGRLSEVANMMVGDVKFEGNNVSVLFRISKTIPREVPLCETLHHLIRWLGNHPNRNNPNAPLWCHMWNKNKINEPISTIVIENTFWKIKQQMGSKKKLSPHCFRKNPQKATQPTQ